MASQSDARRAPSGAFGNPSLDEVTADASGEHPIGTPEGADARQPLSSGAFPSRGGHGDESPFAALAPYYAATRDQSEHAVLDIPDPIIGQRTALSASSLVPPPSKPFPIGPAVAIVATLALGAAAGALLLARSPATQSTEAVAVVTPAAPDAIAQPAVDAIAQPAVPAAAAVADVPGTPASAPPAVPETVSAAEVQPSAESPQREAAHLERPQQRQARRAAAPAAAQAPSAQPVAEPEAPGANDLSALTLPTTPTREQIAAGFNALIPQLKQCAAGVQGLASAKVTIAASGAVRYAVVSGAFQGTPAGSCMARALRGATFPEFARESISVEYPFSL